MLSKGRKVVLNPNGSPSSKGHIKQGSLTSQKQLEGDRSFSVSQLALSNFPAEPTAGARGRIAIFIDAASLFRAALQLGLTLDYRKLLTCLVEGDHLLRCFFYTGISSTNEKQQGFLLWMRRNGYRVIAKELTHHPDGFKKANVAVEIAVDMLSLVGYYDTAVLISGDGDLAYALDAVSYKGIQTEVIGLRSKTSEGLIRIADRYIDLEQIKDQIQKAP